MTWTVPLVDLDYGASEMDSVANVLQSKWLTLGKITKQFEDEFAAYLGVKHAIAVASGTAALHLANIALDVAAGDEVIMPSLSFVATANATKYVHGTPVFADIESSDELGIAPAAIESSITAATKAIVVVHYGGYACAMESIVEIARRHRLPIIEDAAHAPGASLDGKKLGAIGDIGCFSFFSNKNLATGEGGMVVTNRSDLADRMRLLRSHAMTSVTSDRHAGRARTYDVVELGFNYRFDEIRAALGIVQLSKLEVNNTRRRDRTRQYREALQPLEGVKVAFESNRCESAAHLFPILLDQQRDRDAFMRSMAEFGVQTSIHYPPIHRFRHFIESSRVPPALPVTEDVADRVVSLPLFPTMTREQVECVVDAVRRCIR